MVHALISENGKIKKGCEVLNEFFINYDGEKPIVIHFHGGLVPQERGMQTAKRLHQLYCEAGGHPLFFVWKSGLVDTLTHNLAEIWEEPLFRRLLDAILRMVVGQMRGPTGTKALSGNAVASRRVLENEFKKECPFEGYEYIPVEGSGPSTQEIEAMLAEYRVNELLANTVISDTKTKSIGASEKVDTLIDESIVKEIEAGVCKDATKSVTISATAMLIAVNHTRNVISRVFERIHKGRDHGVHATVVEEIFREFYLSSVGHVVWKLMKEDTQDAFKDDAGSVGTEFLNRLGKVIEDGGNPRVILIGHSTGAVYINNFLKAASKKLPPETKFDVIFLAAACTFKSFAEILQYHKPMIKNIRTFGMKDSFEKKDQLIKVPIYPHSLLYFVSGICEDEPDEPILGMERYFVGDTFKKADQFQTIVDVAAFLSEGNAHAYWSKCSDGPGLNTMSLSHGAFDDDEDTLKSVQHVIKGGY